MVRMEENDLELVEQVCAGDTDAFRELVERHSRRLFKVAYRLTGSEANADDVVQETLLRAFRNIHRFDARSQVGTWLYRIAVNCSMDLMRKESRRTARRWHTRWPRYPGEQCWCYPPRYGRGDDR